MYDCWTDPPVRGTVHVNHDRRPGLHHANPRADARRGDDGYEQLVAHHRTCPASGSGSIGRHPAAFRTISPERSFTTSSR